MTSANTPSWIKPELFEEILREQVKGYKAIETFKVYNALKSGENFATLMLKVDIDVRLEDGQTANQTFMLKLAHDTELHRKEMAQWNMFNKEAGMYNDIVPEFQQMYRDKGLAVEFCAMSHKLPVTDKEYILLEDLGRRGFRNVNRLEGLDLEHCKNVLRKMAQWHAASAVRVSRKGIYPEIYLNGYLVRKPNGRLICETIFENVVVYMPKSVERCSNSDAELIKKVHHFYPNILEILYALNEVDDNEFNVLNHGDVWSNNIMFQYHPNGDLKDSLLLDYQAPRYSSPAQDLWYFILSSSKLELKTDHFDEMIHYYHDNLIEHLQLLDYQKPLPKLREIHCSLLKHSAWAALTVSCMMAGVLCEPSSDVTLDNMAGDGSSTVLLDKMYFNERFLAHLEKLLPWLNNKGVFDD